MSNINEHNGPNFNFPAGPAAADSESHALYDQPISPSAEQYGTQFQTAPGYYAPPAAAASSSLTQSLNQRSSFRGKTAGLLAAAVLAGALGGGGATLGLQHLFGGKSNVTSATQTEIVQTSGSGIDWQTVANSATQAVVSIQVAGVDGSSSQGSGVVIDAAGHIVTNNHVVSSNGGATLTVTMGNYSYDASVIGTDPTTDLAVIKLVEPPADLQVMSFADSDSLVVGQEVMAIGNPLGLDDTVTTGIVSALNRPVTTEAVTTQQPGASFQTQSSSSDVVVTAAIQTNAAINPGNSGGALVNSAGQLVGITSSIASLSSDSSSSSKSGNIGLGFAIPANQVKYVADQLIENGVAQHGQIGVTAKDLQPTGALGATIAQVTSGSPAEEAGLQVGDLVTAVDGAPVASTKSLVALVRNGEVGVEMELTVLRNGTEHKIKVAPAAASR